MLSKDLVKQRYNVMSCGIKRIVKLEEATVYHNIIVLNDNSVDISSRCMYSWSADGICWTDWVDLKTYDKICSQREGDFYLKILLEDSLGGILLDGVKNTCYSICIDSSNVFLEDHCGDENLFRPYNNLDCALLLQQQLADTVICIFGVPIYYIQIDPDKDTVDYTFKEYSLHHVTSIKQIKLMISEGRMPSSNPTLNEFDFDWDTDWETEISKRQFAKAFGDNVYPKTGDCIYIPMMHRMWRVNASYDEKNTGLMWRSTTWKMSLVKYNENTNVDTNDFEGIIDNWIKRYEDDFGEYEQNEQQRLMGASPMSGLEYTPTNLYDIFMEDAVRKSLTKYDISILEKQYNQKSVILAKNIYKFKNKNSQIIYQKPICGDSGTIMFLLETPGRGESGETFNILAFGEVSIDIGYEGDSFILSVGEMRCHLSPFKTYMVMMRWDRLLYTSELHIYEYTHKQGVPQYLLRPELYWFDFENPVDVKINAFNDDYNIKTPMTCSVKGYPVEMTNIKYYNKYLDKEEALKEMMKYTTTHPCCVINDIARPIEIDHGYAVR